MIINRPQYLEKLARFKDKDLIKVITGVRRSGKSVLLFDIFYKYLSKRVLIVGISLKLTLKMKMKSILETAKVYIRK